MFQLMSYKTFDVTTQGIGVAARLASDTTWRFLTYAIPVGDDPAAWIAANAAQITTDLPTGRKLAIVDLVRHLLDEGRSAEASTVIDDLDDIADVQDRPAYLRITKALALVLLDEFNALRSVAGLPARTAAQLQSALRSKYKDLA